MSDESKKEKPKKRQEQAGRGIENLPVKLGKEYEVDITETTPNGEGIARINGFLVFVPNKMPGDHVKVKIVRLDSASADAEIVK